MVYLNVVGILRLVRRSIVRSAAIFHAPNSLGDDKVYVVDFIRILRLEGITRLMLFIVLLRAQATTLWTGYAEDGRCSVAHACNCSRTGDMDKLVRTYTLFQFFVSPQLTHFDYVRRAILQSTNATPGVFFAAADSTTSIPIHGRLPELPRSIPRRLENYAFPANLAQPPPDRVSKSFALLNVLYSPAPALVLPESFGPAP